MIIGQFEGTAEGGGQSNRQQKEKWTVHETMVMQNTSNMLVTGANERHQHCFLVKPSPSHRRTDLMSTA